MQVNIKFKGFIRHGVVFKGKSGNQLYGDCPFTGKEDKFYVNKSTLLWDSKTAGIGGNFQRFLEYVHTYNLKEINSKSLQKLSNHRHIPVEALKKWGIGKSGARYTLPIRNVKNKIMDIRCYHIGKRFMSTPTCSTGLLGIDKMVKSSRNTPVYICEGEWDCMIFDWLLKQNKLKGIAVAVPGATVFKREWAFYFKGRECYVLYDNDNAGENGEHYVIDRIKSIAKSLKFLHWLKEFPSGYDIRDFISLIGIKKKTPKKCLSSILRMCKDFPRKEFTAHIVTDYEEKKPKLPVDLKMNWKKLKRVISKWLKLDTYDAVVTSVAVVISNYTLGDPLWIQLVAIPGGCKTEIISMFKHCEEVYVTSSLTPNALISGMAIGKDGREPSLLPRLDGKTLCIKDMSTIQTMREQDREHLYGIFRDAYDGAAGKEFGTGVSKMFKSRFSMLMGATPSVYESVHSAQLGERFLKIFLGDFTEHKNQIQIILKAMDNVESENKMREEMACAMYSYIENIKKIVLKPNYSSPTVSKELNLRIAYLAMWVACLRGTVTRDKYHREVVTSKAYTELGTRPAKQIKRIALNLPTAIEKGYVGERDFEILREIMLDSISAREEDIFRCVYLKCPTIDDALLLVEISKFTFYSISTVNRVIEDMVVLGILIKVGMKRPHKYTVSDKLREYTIKSGLYISVHEKKRYSRAIFLTRKRKKLKLRKRINKK